MTLGHFMRGAARFVIGSAGIVALVVFFIAAQQDHTATASASAALCLALFVLAALDLESFEGLGIKASLKTTLSDAEMKVQGLDRIIATLARATFVQVARGPLTIDEQQEIVADLSAALKTSKMSDEQIETLKRPIYEAVAQRFWHIFGSIRASYTSLHANRIQTKIMNTAVGPEQDAMRAEVSRLLASVNSEHPTESNYKSLRGLLERSASITPLVQDSDRVVIDRMVARLSDLYEEFLRNGNYTPAVRDALTQAEDMRTPFMASLRQGLTE